MFELPRTTAELKDCLKNKMWRLHNLYYIVDTNGRKVKFVPNSTQLKFLEFRHGLDIVLKARQLGISTLVQIDMLDECLFKRDVSAGVIAHTIKDARHLLKTKFRSPYDHLPDAIKDIVYPVSDSKEEFELNNGSIIRVGTSLRSSTINYLHISEYAKICAKHPEKAQEIRTGALNAVHLGAGQRIVLESTAEGKTGDFYTMCKDAQDKKHLNKPLTELDFKFHFYPWYDDLKYQISTKDIIISERMEQYFESLEAKQKIVLTPEQKAWYAKKEEIQQDKMQREFPSTAEEAFEQAIEGAYYARQMTNLRKRGQICSVPYDPSIPVNTFWDIGVTDYTSILFHQRVGFSNRFIGYYENSGEHFSFYAKVLQDLGYVYGNHYLPHDANHLHSSQTSGTTIDQAYNLLSGEVYLNKRMASKNNGIEASRNILNSCYFDEKYCSKLIAHLDNYRKEWNDHLGTWRDKPLHDEASHGADAFAQFALYYDSKEYNTNDDYDNQDYGIGNKNGRNSITGY